VVLAVPFAPVRSVAKLRDHHRAQAEVFRW
jgi:hypothetical protein